MNTVIYSRGPAGRAKGRQSRLRHRPLRNALMAAASVLVLAVVAVFLIGSSTPAHISFRLSSYAVASPDIIVFGHITNTAGHAVRGAEIRVSWSADGHEDQLSATTDRTGDYRLVLPDQHPTEVTLRVIDFSGGTFYEGQESFSAQEGEAYDVSGELEAGSVLLFFPVGSY